ncbi:MAG: ATP-dependent DNA helicase RecG [Phycisphaerales bacterium]
MGAPEASERVASGAIKLTTPIGQLPGVTQEQADALLRLGIPNVGHLLTHLPSRYEHEEPETTIDQVTPERVVSVRGEVSATRPVTFGRARRFEAVLVDHTGRLDLVWFHMPYLSKRIHPGDRLLVQGKASERNHKIQIANARWELLEPDAEEPEERDARLRPVYPASEAISSRAIEGVIGRVLERATGLLSDHLDDAYRRERELPSLADTYRMIHAPESQADVDNARRRLAYDEFLLLQLGVALKRRHLRERLQAPELDWNETIDQRIRARLPFTLTMAQDHAVQELVRDLTRPVPTNRMVQGDVGSGKTVVALYAMLMAVASGHQGALMAPTELLAEQHYASIDAMLAGSGVRVALLTGSLTPGERESTLGRLASGDIDLIVGTHALLGGKTAFKSLAVAVIDEQHRFGVRQRAQLRTSGTRAETDLSRVTNAVTPHVIVMTATPIPRSIGLTLFGDLDLSVIDALPPGRAPIATRVESNADRKRVYEAVRAEIEAGGQAFVVVPAIDTGSTGGDDELRDLRAVMDELESGALEGKRVAALHGRLKRDTRAHIMERFRAGLIDCLVATTVIEVGVDVPNATVMVVEHADRFGLAQLHQLRGRVGRGSKPGRCVLIGDPTTEDGTLRLSAMAQTTSGFELAERDLEIRGPGEVFGQRQSGAPPFKVADLLADAALLAMARRDAQAWISEAPNLDRGSDALIRRRMMKAHGAWLGLGDVG